MLRRFTLTLIVKKYSIVAQKGIHSLLVTSYLNLLLLVVLLPTLAVASWAQNAAQAHIPARAMLDTLEKKAKRYSENRPSEKIYIHFDKPYYILGEDSRYKAYVVTAPDLSPSAISSVLYLDWINPKGEIFKRQRLKVENGGAAGDFTIDTTQREGTFTLRAYTNWMRNEGPEFFYTRRISVFDMRSMNSQTQGDSARHKIDLQFFREGGTLVAGFKTQIAFKVIDGIGIQVFKPIKMEWQQ